MLAGIKEANTKAMHQAYAGWCNSNYTELSQIYGRCSQAKKDALQDCREAKSRMKGEDFRIISYNVKIFTCGWIVRLPSGQRVFYYVTPNHCRYMYL